MVRRRWPACGRHDPARGLAAHGLPLAGHSRRGRARQEQQLGTFARSRAMTIAPAVSFEFFPPREETGWRQLWETIGKLAPLRPAFVSVTYGAGGTTRERTDGIVRRLRTETPLEPAAHITCVG